MSTPVLEALPLSSPTTGIDPAALRGTRGWSVAARLGWRDALRYRGRTALAMVMIGTPVLLATGLATTVATFEIDERERSIALMGSAELSVYSLGTSPVAERVVSDVVGPADVVEIRSADGRIARDDGVAVQAKITVTDLSSPLTEGLFDLRAGRLPTDTTEIAISPGLADQLGSALGDSVEVSGTARTVVGLAADPTRSRQAPIIVGLPGAPRLLTDDSYQALVLVTPEAPLTATTVRQLEDAGYLVYTRAGLAAYDQGGTFTVGGAVNNPQTVVVAGTALTLVIIQLTLLAGPAFAVGVRQQRRALGQLVAAGADARSLRRVVLAQAGVVGLLGAGVGTLLGVTLALVLATVARDASPWAIGPLDIPWPLLAAAIGVGVLSAVLAALPPAVTAARQSTGAAVGTARGQTGYPWRRALVGITIFVGSAAWLEFASRPGVRDVNGVALGLVTLTIGLLLIVPLLVATLLPIGRVFPPVWRLAMRDSARAAGRSVAAVAAVAAATGGLVAVTTFYSSVWQFERESYTPIGVPGFVLVETPEGVTVEDVTTAVASALPGVDVTPVERPVLDAFYSIEAASCDTGTACDSDIGLITIAPAGFPIYVVDAQGREQDVTEFVARGGLVVDGLYVDAETGGARLTATPVSERGSRDPAGGRSVTVDVLVADDVRTSFGATTVMSAATADRLLGAEPAGVVVGDGSLVRADVDRLRETIEGPGQYGYLTAETGYQRQTSVIYLALVLAAMAAVVGGTLGATALTLADARRERAVVAAVGAPPRTARLSAGATAVVTAFVGALAGVTLGLVPGIIGARSQTDWSYSSSTPDPAFAVDPTIVIPWLAILGVVVVLPLLLGGVVALVARGPEAIEGAHSNR